MATDTKTTTSSTPKAETSKAEPPKAATPSVKAPSKEPVATKKPEAISALVYIRDFMSKIDKDFAPLLEKFHNSELHLVEEWHKILDGVKSKKISLR